MKAIIFGASGNQGYYLCQFLHDKGYEVHGVVREKNVHQFDFVTYHVSEMGDGPTIFKIINDVRPAEIYNLAAMNDVARSFRYPIVTMNINCGGLLRIIEAVMELNMDCKIYFASSSEMFGNPVESPQTETTPFSPRSPYGVSKVAGVELARIYRDRYKMKIYVGIIYNNESPQRPPEFLSKKVCRYVASVVNGNTEKLKLGNLEARRDFGYAKEYCEWTWRIMQHPVPEDFILATGMTRSVKDFVIAAFEYVGIWDWEKYIESDPSLFRPSEDRMLVGSAGKSFGKLNFTPKTTFRQLIEIMMGHELNQYKKAEDGSHHSQYD